VDEYQDTNHAQFVLVSLLASGVNEDGITEHNLCVVGDDDQSIYRFRGADISNILDFEKTFPNTKDIKLEQNYRSTKNIIGCANEVIKNNPDRKAKSLWTDNEDGEPVTFTMFPNAKAEAKNVADAIINGNREHNTSYNDFAILYRTNAQSRYFEEEFIRRNIPYRLIGGQNFYGRKEIKDLLAYLRALNNTNDDVSLTRIINVPKR
ncbi:MAG: UvrD-helicase domain-containing protein, partial [Lachnospiraceae bacterium]|nr:UvrD-helicase domain-containing protein [Lachnospiraceae bacterium]